MDVILHIFTYHLYYVYLITTYKIVMNFGAWIDLIPLLKVEKALDCI